MAQSPPHPISEQHRCRLFEQALEGLEELGGQGTVHGAMVGGEVDGHHGADFQLVAHDDRPLLRRADSQDADLREVEDGVEVVDAEHPEVRDREAAAGHLVGGQLHRAGGLIEGLAARADLLEAEQVGVAEDGHDQPAVERDRDAHVDVAVLNDGVADERGVHAGVLAQGQRDGLGDEVADGELDLLLGQRRIQTLTNRHNLINADVDRDVDLGGLLLGLDHAVGDGLPHPGELDPRITARGGRGLRGGGLGRRGRLAGGDEGLDVAADDAAAGAAGVDLIQVHTLGGGDLASQRARLDAAAGGACGDRLGRVRRGGRRVAVGAHGLGGVARGGGRLVRGLRDGGRRGGLALARRGGDGLGVLALLGQDQEVVAHWDFLARLGQEDGDDALVERFQRHDRLVGLDVGDGRAFLDGVADLDLPLDNLPARHRRADRTHLDFDRHGGLSRESPSRGARIGRSRARLGRIAEVYGAEIKTPRGLGRHRGPVRLFRDG